MMRMRKPIGIALAGVALTVLGWTLPDDASSQRNHADFEATLRELERVIEQRPCEEALRQIAQAQARFGSPEQVGLLNHLRARALHGCPRHDETQRRELIALWEQARQRWKEWGSAPLEVEATLALAFCYWQTERTRAEQLLNEVWARIGTESSQPLELAQALSARAKDWFRIKEWAICQRLWERALALQRAHNADELTLARTHYNLGVLALRQNQLEIAQGHLPQALTAYEQHAPESLSLAATLKALGELAQRQARFADAQRNYQRALRLYEAHQMSSLETAQVHLGLGDLALKQRRWNEAQTHYTRARQIAEAIDPTAREHGQALAGLGVVALESGKLEDAAQLLEQALQNPNLEPRDRMQLEHEQGRLAQRRGALNTARERLERVLEQQRSLQEPPTEIARTLHNLGTLALEQGELSQARAYFSQAWEIRQRDAAHAVAAAHSLMGLGFVALAERKLAEAQRLFEQARAIYEASEADHAERSRVLTGLGIVATEQGALSDAQTLLEHARDLQLAHGLANTALHAHTLIAIGNLMLRRGEWDAAFRQYDRACRLAETLPAGQLLRAQALVGLGNLALRQRDFQRAESYYQQSWEILSAHAPRSPLLAQVDLNLGILALELGETERATKIFEEASGVLERLPDSELAIRARLNLAILELRTNKFERVPQRLQSVIEWAQGAGGNPLLLAQALYYRGAARTKQRAWAEARADFEQALARYAQVAPNTIFVALAQLNLAKLDYRAGDMLTARTRLEKAIEIIEQQRNLILDPETQAAFSERYFEAYSLLALLEATQGQYARALELLERSRARTLAEQIQRTRLELPNAPAELIELFAQRQRLEAQSLELRRQIAALYAEHADAPETAERDARPLLDSLIALESKQRQLEESLRTQFPNAAQLLAPRPPTSAEIQRLLEPNLALLYHAIVEDNLLIIAVSRQAIVGYHGSVNATRLAKDIEAFREAIATENEGRLVRLGADLYRTLVEPVADFLSDFPRVLLCPEGVLQQLPWAALVVHARNDQPTYWVERVALHLTPALGVYRYARLWAPSTRGALIAAVSKYAQAQDTPPVEVAQTPRERGRALEDIPAAAKEAEALKQLLRDAIVLREGEVDPEQLREQARTARIVHFACHAEANHQNPLQSVLKFGVAREKWLTAAQIITSWRLQADLVMLSACETAEGKVDRYEGVLGLARAFLHAGAKTVGATLWQVEDESAAILVEQFYRAYARSSLPKDLALQRAQQQMLRRGYLPYYWAAFVIIGDCQ